MPVSLPTHHMHTPPHTHTRPSTHTHTHTPPRTHTHCVVLCLAGSPGLCLCRHAHTHAPGWGRQHHSQRDPPFVPSKCLSSCGGILELRRGSQPSPWVGPGKPNLPLGLRGKAGGGARVTAGPKSPHLGVCPGPNIPLQGRKGSRGCIPGSSGESGLVSRGSHGEICHWRSDSS